MFSREDAQKITNFLMNAVDYHTREDVLDDIACMLEECEDRISNFVLAEPRYLAGDYLGYLKKIHGESYWDIDMGENDTIQSCAERCYREDKESTQSKKKEIAMWNKLVKVPKFIDSHVGSNRLVMWMDMTVIQIRLEKNK